MMIRSSICGVKSGVKGKVQSYSWREVFARRIWENQRDGEWRIATAVLFFNADGRRLAQMNPENRGDAFLPICVHLRN
jgi:hypothetical protein